MLHRDNKYIYDKFNSSGGGKVIPKGNKCSYPYITYALPVFTPPSPANQACGRFVPPVNLGYVGGLLFGFLGQELNYTKTLWSYTSTSLVPTNNRLSADASDSSTVTIDSASNTMILVIVVPLVALLLLATVVFFFYCRRRKQNISTH